jgi:hypothetical protein
VNSRAAKLVKIAVVFEVLFGVMDQVRCGERLFTYAIRQFGGMCFTAFSIKPSKLLLMVSSSGYSQTPPSNPEVYCQFASSSLVGHKPGNQQSWEMTIS